jgi:hypothetical protein
MSDRILTHRIALAVALGRRGDCHRVLDSYLGTLPDGRPVVRLRVPLERRGAPGEVVAWGASTGARASVYGPILTPMMEAMIPEATAVEERGPIMHVRWPTEIDKAAQTRAAGYVITHALDEATGDWVEYASWLAMLTAFDLAPLSGDPDEQASAIARAELVEAAAEAGTARVIAGAHVSVGGGA